ncbi:MAG: SDR family oxidoreductase [Thermomicrobiales bacterium]
MSDQAITRRVAIITGASRRQGIGAAICRALATRGCDILFTHWSAADAWSPDPEGPPTLLSELRALGVHAGSISVDLADANAATVVLDAVMQELGHPTILVNNAAHSTRDGFMALDAATLDAHYAVNLRSTALLSVEFARRHVSYREQAAGTAAQIINMTSGQGLGPMPGELAYIATKGAIDALTVTLAAELAPHQITVNAVDPGATETGWMTPDVAAKLRGQSPTGQIGQPEDAARLVAFLASDEAAWITGQVIRSRGGMG